MMRKNSVLEVPNNSKLNHLYLYFSLSLVLVMILMITSTFGNIKLQASINGSSGLNKNYVVVMSSTKINKYYQMKYNNKITSGKWKIQGGKDYVTVDKKGYVKIKKNTPSMKVKVTFKDEICTLNILKKANAVFVGNSLTYNTLKNGKEIKNNSSLFILKRYFINTGRNVSIKYSRNYKSGYKGTILGGRTLEQAYKGKNHYSDDTTRNVVLDNKPNFIVLQEQTTKLLYNYLNKKYSNSTNQKEIARKNAISKSLKKLSFDGSKGYSYTNESNDVWTVYESYENWINYIYNVRNKNDIITVVYIPPAPIANEINSSLKLAKKYYFTDSEITKFQKEAYKELVNSITAYINKHSNIKDKVLFAPVVESWYDIMNKKVLSRSQLYSNDNRHPAPYGQYVIASSLFYTISGAPKISVAKNIFSLKLWENDHNIKIKFTFNRDKINKIRQITHRDAINYNH